MLDRLGFDQGVRLLVEWDEEHETGHVRRVLYDYPDGVQHATQLAASIGVPVQLDSGFTQPPDRT